MATKEPAEVRFRPTIISLRPSAGSSFKEITLIESPPSSSREAHSAKSLEYATPVGLVSSHARAHANPTPKYQNFLRVNQVQPYTDPLSLPLRYVDHSSAVVVGSRKIPRPPNAFMVFANEWRKQLAQQHPTESNKTISVRLGALWKTMSKASKEVYFQRSRQAGQDHKQKYPGYVYNPKEARMRKALREHTRGGRSAPTRWTKYALNMNHRQSLVSPVMLSQQPRCGDSSKTMLHEQAERDNMLQNYPDYLDLPYSIPSNDYPLDNQSWYSYVQPGVQSNGPYSERESESKLPVDWSTPYSSEQGNFISASPQSPPYSLQNHQEVSSLLLNGDRGPVDQPGCDSSCLVTDHKPAIDPIICQNTDTLPDSTTVKDPEQQVKELLASSKVIPENIPVMNGKLEESSSTKLPGFHQAFGSTEIGRFSQPDGFFEAAVAAENERKPPEMPEFTSFPHFPESSAWTSSFFSCKPEPDLFGFEETPYSYTTTPSQCNEPNYLYTMEESFYNPECKSFTDQTLIKNEDSVGSEEFEPQDLSAVTNIGKPPVIISQNDNCCVVLESSAMDNDVKEYFSL